MSLFFHAKWLISISGKHKIESVASAWLSVEKHSFTDGTITSTNRFVDKSYEWLSTKNFCSQRQPYKGLSVHVQFEETRCTLLSGCRLTLRDPLFLRAAPADQLRVLAERADELRTTRTFKQTDTCTQLIHHPVCCHVLVCLGPPIISVVGGVSVCVCVCVCVCVHTFPESSMWSDKG